MPGVPSARIISSLQEYNTTTWSPYTRKYIKSVEAVQCRAARFTVNDYKRTSSVTDTSAQTVYTMHLILDIQLSASAVDVYIIII